MLRFISTHWTKLGILGIFYALIIGSLSTLTNVQIDAMQNHLQFVDHKSSGGGQ